MAEPIETTKIEARCSLHTPSGAAPHFWHAGLRIPAEWTEFEVTDAQIEQLEVERAKGAIQMRMPQPPPEPIPVVVPAAKKKKAKG